MALSAQPKVAIEFDAGVWTDVSADATNATWTRGRQFELDSFSAGTASVTLKNADRKYDPEYTSGTYYGKLLPRKRIRIGFAYSATTYWKFYGYINGWPQAYAGPKMSFVTVTATDAFKVFAKAQVPSVWQQKMRAETPRAWYRLGESAGTVGVDSSGNRYDGAYQGGATFNSRTGLVFGDSDSAIAFSNGGRYMIPPKEAGAQGAAYSVEMWFDVPSSYVTSTVQFTLYDQIDSVNSGDRFRIYLQPLSGELYVFTHGDLFTNGTVYADDTTHHLVVTWDGTTRIIYIDGALVHSVAGAAYAGVPANVAIGDRADSTSTTGTDEIVMDEVAIYDEALSAGTVLDHYEAGTAPWDGDTPKARIDSVLDYLNWPSGDRDLDTGSASLVAAALEKDALSHLEEVELSEGGRFFVDRTGRATLIGRQNFWTEAVYNTSNATFGDSGSELKYAAKEGDLFGLDDEKIVNEARVAQSGGSEQIAYDAASADPVTGYGLSSRSEATLESRPGVARDRADYLVFKYKDPALRMPQVEIKPERSASTLYPVVAVNDLGYRYTFKRRPQAVGSAISKEFHVESEAGVMTPGDITITWELSPAEPQFWILGTSVLGTDTRPGY